MGKTEVPGADITFVSGDVRPVHRAMTRAAQGRNIWIAGGGALAAAFAEADLPEQHGPVAYLTYEVTPGHPGLPFHGVILLLSECAQLAGRVPMAGSAAPPARSGPGSPLPLAP